MREWFVYCNECGTPDTWDHICGPCKKCGAYVHVNYSPDTLWGVVKFTWYQCRSILLALGFLVVVITLIGLLY